MTQLSIMIIQSRTTGRFLLKFENNKWTFPSVLDNDPFKPIVYMAMDDCAATTGQDVQENDWLLDFVPDPNHQVFHMWISNEPMGTREKVAWHSLFDFPENTDQIVAEMLENRQLLDRVVSPAI